MKKAEYEKQVKKLQLNLVALQHWVIETNQRVVIIFEGRDASGKGGVIKAITQHLNPRHCRVVALGVPSETEKGQWYFQRYVNHLPTKGEIVIFDRSWYNRAGVERVMGFCTDAEYKDFLLSCPQFENSLIQSGTLLFKYWLSVSYNEQEKRFNERLTNPLKRWKFSPMDLESRAKWKDYAVAKDEMFKHTDTRISPWRVVESDDKRSARLNIIDDFLQQIDYEDLPYPNIELPNISHNESDLVRPEKQNYHYIKQKFNPSD